MQFVEGAKINGFTLKKGRYIPEQDATLYEFIHDKTGAELCFMDCDIENKLFYAAFKTIPFDNTGVFHILEHSVLCGSEQFPVREPFVELLKSSMQTFLNAITFPDKTVYPCSSRNEKDFLNLTEVYLDAVFAPRCTKDENIFLQEGWHWETDENGTCFKGVVFNEMKGAMAGADNITERSLGNVLFPDTCYGFNSGGDPKSIPDLSFDTFKKTYNTFYHPSNCRFYLDGSIPVEKTLLLINKYLDRFEKLPSLPEIKFQNPVSCRKDVFYAINDDEEEEGKALFTLGRIFTGWDEKEKTAAMMLLIEVLTDSNSSPLKKAILDKGLGEDLDVNLETGTAQSYITVTVRNTDKEKEEEIIEVWDQAIRQLIQDGIDREELDAALAALEYRFREPSEPRGLYRGITALDSWLYGGDPALYLTYEDLLVQLRNRLDRNGFAELLPELLSDAKGMCRMWTLPSRTKAASDLQEENSRLQKMLESETEEEFAVRAEKNNALFKWQSTPDTEEQLHTLPELSLQDIPTDLYRFPSEVMYSGTQPFLAHKTDTSGVIYAYYYFKLTDIPISRLSALNFLTTLLTELPTLHHPDIRELQRQIKLLMGNVSFSIRTEAKDNDKEHCTTYFIAKFSTIPRNAEKAAELIKDILLNTDISVSDIVYRILLQEKESMRQSMIMRGDSAAITQALASCTARYAVTSVYTGYEYLRFLTEFSENYEKERESFCETVRYLQNNSFTLARMLLSLTANEIPDPVIFLNGFPKGVPVADMIAPEIPTPKHIGIRLPVPIGFSAAAWFNEKGKISSVGSLSVAAKILSLNALWNKIRVSGGAYGAGFSARRDNCFVCYSFRDPTPLKSIQVFKELSQDLIRWCEGNEKIDKYIISTISDMEPLISTSALAGLEDSRYLCGYTHEKRVETRKEMLKTEKRMLLPWADAFRTFASEMNTCLVGGEHLITEPGRTVIDL